MVSKTPKTLLPSDLVLYVQDKRDLCELEETYQEIDFYYGRFPAKFNLTLTTNVGIHYFCIENSFHLRALASNENLTEHFIHLIFNQLNYSESSDDRDIVYNILRNSVVYENAILFETIFNKVFPDDEIDVLMGLRGMVFTAPINILMFVLPHVGNLVGMKNLVLDYLDTTKMREEEILEWVAINNKPLAKLPLSWVLKAYGM